MGTGPGDTTVLRGDSTMRRLCILLALILAPVAASAGDFDCRAQAFDLTAVDPASCLASTDLATCPLSCTRPVDAADPARCFVLPLTCTDPADLTTCTAVPAELPRLPDAVRAVADQPLLRRVTVHSGPHTDAILSTVSLNELADAMFTAARDRLCVPPPPPPPPPPVPNPGGPPPVRRGPGLIGGSPGLIGGNPGLIGGNPGLIGPDPGISIRR